MSKELREKIKKKTKFDNNDIQLVWEKIITLVDQERKERKKQ